MAKKPDGGAARTERVTFTKPAAERIAKVVRTVEGGDRDAGPLTFGMRATPSNAKVFRVCTFTGAWSIGETKTITFKYQSPPNTVEAVNLFFPVTSTQAGSRDCAIAKEKNTWYLIDVVLGTATAVFARATATSVFARATHQGISVSGTTSSSVITSIKVSGALNSSCNVVISSTPTTSSFTFITSTASAVFVSTTATGIFVQSTYTATFLTFGV